PVRTLLLIARQEVIMDALLARQAKPEPVGLGVAPVEAINAQLAQHRAPSVMGGLAAEKYLRAAENVYADCYARDRLPRMDPAFDLWMVARPNLRQLQNFFRGAFHDPSSTMNSTRCTPIPRWTAAARIWPVNIRGYNPRSLAAERELLALHARAS